MSAIKHNLDVPKLLFWAAILFAVFLAGGLFSTKELPPYQTLLDGYRSAKTLLNQSRQDRPDYIEKIMYPGDGVTVNDTTQTSQGITLIQGWFKEGLELRLIAMNGSLIQKWPLDFHKIWPSPEHIIPQSSVPVTRFNYHTMGIWLFPNGSVMVNFNELGTVKLNKCRAVEWTLDRMTHHSITPTKDGLFWIPVKGDSRNLADNLLLPGVTKERLLTESRGWYEDRLILINAEGKILKELSVLQSLFDAGLERQLFDANIISKFDPTHVNDIDLVNKALAKKISGIAVGDLLVSIREMHMLAILDQNTGKLKWFTQGPWVRQHDPDISDTGMIEIFNNRSKNFKLGPLSGSNLMSLDPQTKKTEIIYPINEQDKFFTYIMGAHQKLDNGNRLVIESMSGRVFEINPNGQIVWQFIKAYDQNDAAVIDSAIRYSTGYLSTNDWSCH